MDTNLIEKIGNRARYFLRNAKMNLRDQKSVALAGIVFFLFITLISFFAPPKSFPIQTYLDIKKGTSLVEIGTILKESHYIKSKQLFTFFTVVFGRQKGVIAGEYFFEHKITSVELAWRLVHGKTKVAPVSVTIFEGSTNEEIAETLEKQLFEFDKEKFLALTASKEGYLFPDTYHFKRKSSPEEIIETLEKTFFEKTQSLLPIFAESGKSIDEIIIMASILEKEASRNMEEKKVISGILWKRIEIDMALQVDATLKYITGKGSAQLTHKDLQTDFPYNTYTNKGLPPGPIGNPGLVAMKAAAQPTKSSYLYYMHDLKGNVYYGGTYQKHLENIRNHLYK